MATSTMKLTAKMGADFRTDIKCSHEMIIDQPKASGGTDLGANPLEYYFSGLAGCMCAIARIVAMHRRIELKAMEVTIEGDINKDFLLGKTQEGRAGFTEIRLLVNIDAPMTDEEKMAFIHEVENRCPVADNVQNGTTIKAILA